MSLLKIAVSWEERPGSCVVTSEARWDEWPAMVDEQRFEFHAPLDRHVKGAVEQILESFLSKT